MLPPISATPILRGKDAEKFLAMVCEDSKIPAGPVPTPKLEQAKKFIREYVRERQEHS